MFKGALWDQEQSSPINHPAELWGPAGGDGRSLCGWLSAWVSGSAGSPRPSARHHREGGREGGQRDTERGQSAQSLGTSLTDLLFSTGHSPGACTLGWASSGESAPWSRAEVDGGGRPQAWSLLSPSLCFPEGGSHGLTHQKGDLHPIHPCIPGLSSMHAPWMSEWMDGWRTCYSTWFASLCVFYYFTGIFLHRLLLLITL